MSLSESSGVVVDEEDEGVDGEGLGLGAELGFFFGFGGSIALSTMAWILS